MIIDFARLALGLMVVLFHRPIADFVMIREQALDDFFRSRGVRFPAPPSEGTARNLYFGLGFFVCVISMFRIWIALP
jgi:hypothetical protein